MSTTLEERLGNVMHEIKEIKKEIILQRHQKIAVAQNKIKAWEALAEKVSSKWAGGSAVEEISQQREKS